MDDEVRDVDAWQGAVTGALLAFHVECAAPERTGDYLAQPLGHSGAASAATVSGTPR